MAFLVTFLQNPVTIGTLSGLALGLCITLYILIKTRLLKNELEEEIADARYDYRRLEEQMNTQMRVSVKAQEDLQNEINEHLKTIANLQDSVKALGSRTSRKEIKQINILHRAEEILAEKSSGTVLAWENAKTQAETEYIEAEKGIKPILRKVFKTE